MMKVEYKIYNPSGNITALVLGDAYTEKQKHRINDEVMKKHREVEQVGFLSLTENKLSMAGGEFCGNATRCATKYYLKGQEGEIRMKVSGTNQVLETGQYDNKEVWTQIPTSKKTNVVQKLEKGNYQVSLEGITHIVITEKIEKVKREAIIQKYIQSYREESALGIIFLEESDRGITISPYVWVKEIHTLFYEQSCGSGSAAVGLLKSFLNKNSISKSILQPSGDRIQVMTEYKENEMGVSISGRIDTDNQIRTIEIKEE